MRKSTKVFLLLASTICVGVVAYFVYQSGQSSITKYETVRVQRHDLLQLVSVTGVVKPVTDADLAYEVGGRVAFVLADIGDHVKAGDSIVKLVNADLSAQFAQASAEIENQRARLRQMQAALDVEESQLAQMKRGPRQEEIQVTQTKLENAKSVQADAMSDKATIAEKASQDLRNAYEGARDAMNQSLVSIDGVMNTQTDAMFSHNYVDKGELVFIVSDPSVASLAKNRRQDVLALLEKLSQSLLNFPLDQASIDQLLVTTQNDVLKTQDYLFALSDALAKEVNLSDANAATFQANVQASFTQISTARSQVSSQLQTISAQKSASSVAIDTATTKVNDAQRAVALAENELGKLLAGTSPEDIASQQARIVQARANLDAQNALIASAISQRDIISANISKTILRSPINGIVTRQDAKVGEIVQINSVLVTVISNEKFEIETHVPEVDIASIQIGDKASLTLDAYGPDENFQAEVLKIDPAEVVIEGISTYRVTLHFLEDDARIKSGMTANLDITTNKADGVLAIPQRTVYSQNGKKFVHILQNGQSVEQEVRTGILSWDGFLEIVSGLSEGAEVIAFVEPS